MTGRGMRVMMMVKVVTLLMMMEVEIVIWEGVMVVGKVMVMGW